MRGRVHMVGKTFAASVWCGMAMAGLAITVSGCQGHKEDANSRFEALYTTEWKWRQEQFADDEDSRKPHCRIICRKSIPPRRRRV